MQSQRRAIDLNDTQLRHHGVFRDNEVNRHRLLGLIQPDCPPFVDRSVHRLRVGVPGKRKDGGGIAGLRDSSVNSDGDDLPRTF